MMLTQASAADFPAVCDLYEAVCRQLAGRGMAQWRWGSYPSVELIRQDIEAGTLYLLRQEDQLLAAVSIDRCFEPVYDGVAWQIQGTPGTFHRLAIAPHAQGQGLAQRLLPEILDRLRAMGCDCLRCDTFSENAAALHLYETKLGMRRAGEIFHEGEGDGKPYIPLELRL